MKKICSNLKIAESRNLFSRSFSSDTHPEKKTSEWRKAIKCVDIYSVDKKASALPAQQRQSSLLRVYEMIRPTGFLRPRMYGLPKTHKKDV